MCEHQSKHAINQRHALHTSNDYADQIPKLLRFRTLQVKRTTQNDKINMYISYEFYHDALNNSIYFHLNEDLRPSVKLYFFDQN